MRGSTFEGGLGGKIISVVILVQKCVHIAARQHTERMPGMAADGGSSQLPEDMHSN